MNLTERGMQQLSSKRIQLKGSGKGFYLVYAEQKSERFKKNERDVLDLTIMNRSNRYLKMHNKLAL